MPEPTPLIECVVNVSEGRNAATLEAIATAISAVEDCYLLHRDVGPGAHRTVFTFAGPPEAVFAGALAVYEVAAARIDMREHRGTHPRSGAVDVCPFVPISGISLEEVAARTRVLGQLLAERFDLPVFLYAASATSPDRFGLEQVRRGEYEGLAAKLQLPEWQPDFGPSIPHPRLGATVMGARPFLIAWNINLAPEATLAQARQLAGRLRGSGTKGRPGLFPGLKAIGWHIEEYGRCQVSCNVVDPDNTALARVYLTAVSLADGMRIRVTGSELIGLIPERHLRAAARGFCFEGGYEEEMETAVTVLGLDDLGPFNWRKRVLEAVYRDAAQTDRRSQ
ncbi:glutamate formiminotransferase/formiminotetrahydrofolate cyclodeaminase [Lewinella marina]|uniref:glutamate formimidoyltransferase n=1 Tax=Neolewinella marina TaxID=438751 RepID=A0A2G0CDH5_9BACT|nr:glutamate formimidoyltransferase [Neolewinella marina]NJB86010.1 glutamate formiminotransferase/formiminotetrahydrofolate cyclodeaminase [Neolewinella marina]PHK98023.1 glutamate formimidoyltransferase [Neolewinella marina]